MPGRHFANDLARVRVHQQQLVSRLVQDQQQVLRRICCNKIATEEKDREKKNQDLAHGDAPDSEAVQNHFFYALQIIFRVHPNSVERRLSYVNVGPVLEKTQLLQPLGCLQLRFRQTAEKLKRGLSVSIETKVLEVLDRAAAIA